MSVGEWLLRQCYAQVVIGDIVIGAALCFPLKFCCSERSKFIFVCIFYAWTFLGLKRGRFLKICHDSNLKRQLQLVYSINLNLKKHTQQEICHYLKLIQQMQQEFGVFLNLILSMKQNIYAISTLKWHQKQVFGLISILKRGKFLVEHVVLILKRGKFLKLSSESILKNVRQQESCPVLKLILSINCIYIQSRSRFSDTKLCCSQHV